MRPVAEPFGLAGAWQPQTASLTPTSSRAPTPMPDLSTPRKYRPPASAPSLAHARTGSTSTTRSAASGESSSLFTSLVEAFPSPPPKPTETSAPTSEHFTVDLGGTSDDDDEEGEHALTQLEEALSWCERGGWLDMPASATGPSSPPPAIPLPPLPVECEGAEGRPRGSAAPGLHLPTTFEPPLGVNENIPQVPLPVSLQLLRPLHARHCSDYLVTTDPASPEGGTRQDVRPAWPSPADSAP